MKFRYIFFLLFLITIPTNLFAKSGPPIPVPRLSISEAVDIAQQYFYNKEARIADRDYFKISDYILISAEYTNRFEESKEKEWAWKIIFIHPVQNDHSVVYKVTDDKQIIFLYGSR